MNVVAGSTLNFRLCATFELLIVTTLSHGSEFIDMEAQGNEPLSLVSNIAILEDEPFDIASHPRELFFPASTKVLGELNLLCLVIAASPEASTSVQRKKTHDQLIEDANLRASVTKSDGTEIQFGMPSYSWSGIGRILPDGEISSCLRPQQVDLKINDVLDLVRISAERSISVLGIYWESSNEFDL